MSTVNPAKFVRETRQEMRRVTWPTRKQTMLSTVTVLIFVLIASMIFLLVDTVAASAVKAIIGV
ncbi:MAG: preprotein translocase subunit SecE [Rickettsiales bacterium]